QHVAEIQLDVEQVDLVEDLAALPNGLARHDDPEAVRGVAARGVAHVVNTVKIPALRVAARTRAVASTTESTALPISGRRASVQARARSMTIRAGGAPAT